MAETRKDKRAPVSLKVRFKSATVDEFIEQYSRDVSRGGIFIKSGQPMSVGTLLKFQFQLKDESPLIKGVGRVVWIRSEDDATAENPSGMGIKFIKMDADSRATVDRVVTTHEGEPGTFEQGDVSEGEGSATGQEDSGFFPNLPPAKLPAPEDQTAVRHAAQFLASALSGAGTDEEATREAEQRAEEARRRSAQIEAQRAAEAEKAKQEQSKQEPPPASALPSMIIDPSLGEMGSAAVQVARPAEARPPAPAGRPPATPTRPAAAAKPKPPPPADVQDETEEDTSVTDRNALAGQKPAISSPPSSLPPAVKKSNLVPAIVITAAIMLGGFFALRSDDAPGTELTATSPPSSEAAPKAPVPSVTPLVSPGATEPQPAAATTAGEPNQKASEDAGATARAKPEPTPAAPAPVVEPLVEPVERVAVVVTTVPEAAEISVDGVVRGKSPISIELAKGVEAKISAKAVGRVTAERLVTPKQASNPVRLTLSPVPYIVHIESTPPGAQVIVGGKRGTTPVDLTLNAAPKGMLGVTARLAGHQLAQTTISRDGFVEQGESMRTTVNIELTPLPVRAKTAPIPKPGPAGTTSVKPTPAPAPVPPPEKPAIEAAPVEKPAPAPVNKPPPAPVNKPTPAPGEPIPDNPFG
jgi:uncharacterized protein (TIGR02266 family)